MKEKREFTERELDRIIEMAWEDRTPFEAINYQFDLPEKGVIELMRTHLKESSFKRWRKRVNSGVSQNTCSSVTPISVVLSVIASGPSRVIRSVNADL